jgi:AhpD family alkylhydroperoxidase
VMQTLVEPVEYEDANDEVRAIYDDIMESRGIDFIPNFWRTIAHDPGLLRRTWQTLKEVMAPGALDPLTKEMLAVAVSATNGCEYCIRSHTASARKLGMSDPMLGELMSVVGMFNETNRLAEGYRVEPDSVFFRKPDA